MPVDDALDDCQSNPNAREFGICMQALKSAEQFIGIIHIKARTIVSYKIDLLMVCILYAELDTCIFLFGGKFPGVVNQVFQDNAHKTLITSGNQIWSDSNLHDALPVCLL